jgi:hypothetical protein
MTPSSSSSSSSSSGAPRVSRSTVTSTHRNRTGLARKAGLKDRIALQSSEDEDHLWWMAEVAGVATQHKGAQTKIDGKKLIKNAWYMEVYYYDRPTASSNIFQVAKPRTKHKIDVDGMLYIFKEAELTVDSLGRKRRPLVTVSDATIVSRMDSMATAYNDLPK